MAESGTSATPSRDAISCGSTRRRIHVKSWPQRSLATQRWRFSRPLAWCELKRARRVVSCLNRRDAQHEHKMRNLRIGSGMIYKSSVCFTRDARLD